MECAASVFLFVLLVLLNVGVVSVVVLTLVKRKRAFDNIEKLGLDIPSAQNAAGKDKQGIELVVLAEPQRCSPKTDDEDNLTSIAIDDGLSRRESDQASLSATSKKKKTAAAATKVKARDNDETLLDVESARRSRFENVQPQQVQRKGDILMRANPSFPVSDYVPATQSSRAASILPSLLAQDSNSDSHRSHSSSSSVASHRKHRPKASSSSSSAAKTKKKSSSSNSLWDELPTSQAIGSENSTTMVVEQQQQQQQKEKESISDNRVL